MNGRGPKQPDVYGDLPKIAMAIHHWNKSWEPILQAGDSTQRDLWSQPAINYFGSPFHSLTIPCQKGHHPRIVRAQLPKTNKMNHHKSPMFEQTKFVNFVDFPIKIPDIFPRRNFHSDPLKIFKSSRQWSGRSSCFWLWKRMAFPSSGYRLFEGVFARNIAGRIWTFQVEEVSGSKRHKRCPNSRVYR